MTDDVDFPVEEYEAEQPAEDPQTALLREIRDLLREIRDLLRKQRLAAATPASRPAQKKGLRVRTKGNGKKRRGSRPPASAERAVEYAKTLAIIDYETFPLETVYEHPGRWAEAKVGEEGCWLDLLRTDDGCDFLRWRVWKEVQNHDGETDPANWDGRWVTGSLIACWLLQHRQQILEEVAEPLSGMEDV